MEEKIKQEIIALSKKAHDLTEISYQQDTSRKGDDGWNQKQRILLADMALHLLQTALKEEAISEEKLKRNLYSILTISDQFAPGFGLKEQADRLYLV